jgi:GntR family transcriptional regulator
MSGSTSAGCRTARADGCQGQPMRSDLDEHLPAPSVPLGGERPDPRSRGPRLLRYRSIAAELTRRVGAAEYPPGSLLPSEADLAAEFGVTRMTVRQALAGLASQGLIERRHGHGTVVAPVRLQRQAQRPIGLADELLARGLRPGSRVIEFTEVRVPKEARDALWVGPRATVFRLRRLRYADDVLIGVQESLIPSAHVPCLGDVDFTDQSLTRILRERYGLAATSFELTIEAVGADRLVAAALGVDPGEPVLRSSRISYLEEGRPLERTVGWFLGTRYSYRIRQEA